MLHRRRLYFGKSGGCGCGGGGGGVDSRPPDAVECDGDRVRRGRLTRVRARSRVCVCVCVRARVCVCARDNIIMYARAPPPSAGSRSCNDVCPRLPLFVLPDLRMNGIPTSAVRRGDGECTSIHIIVITIIIIIIY